MATLAQVEKRINEAYFRVPSSWPITREEAVKSAKGMNHHESMHNGICWQGNHGSYEYLRYFEMTEKEKIVLTKHLR